MLDPTARFISIIEDLSCGRPVFVGGRPDLVSKLSSRSLIAKPYDYSGSHTNVDSSIVIAINLHLSHTAQERREFLASLGDNVSLILWGEGMGKGAAIKTEIEHEAFSNGWRNHPLYFKHVGYSEEFGDSYISILDRVNSASREKYGIEWLLENRALHMDMSRECGLRSDAHVYRYAFASQFIRPGDDVLDCACGLGYGSNVIHQLSKCSQITGRDLSDRAIEYARDNFTQSGISFNTGDAQALGDLADESFDVYVSFETLEHLPEPEKLIAEAFRVLRPGGRFIASVPYDWSDETGEDPNPFHLHVYTKAKLIAQLEKHFRVENLSIQNAGGGYKNPTAKKAIFDASPASVEDGEWLLVVGYKDPLVSAKEPFKDTIYPYPNPTKNLLSFSRDYKNPWLMRSFFGIGVRNTNVDERSRMEREILSSNEIGTADHGAALTVRAYRLLDSALKSEIDAFYKAAEPFLCQQSDNAHVQRWQISLSYVCGLMAEKSGDPDLAIAYFDLVVQAKWYDFSPALATKVAAAAYRAGLLTFIQGDIFGARGYWHKGLAIVDRVIKFPTDELVGDMDCPLPDALLEVTQAFKLANRCATCLRCTSDHDKRSLQARWSEMVADEGIRQEVINAYQQDLIEDGFRYRNLRDRAYRLRIIIPVLRLLKRLRRL